LRIEQVANDGKEKFIGIAEIQNSNSLKQDELVRLATSLSNDNLTIQLLNGLLIADEIHLLSAAQNALNAQQGDYMLSRNLDVEIIVFASTQRQIGRALDTLGVYDGIDEIAVVVVGPDINSVENAIRVLIEKIGAEIIPAFPVTSDRIERIKDHYQISEKEIKTISDSNNLESQIVALARCIVSRVSLVAFDN
jgi:tRNA threonylcarbamoyladenosine modification (KEOPS) complex Cgi121 subunit